MKIRGAIEVYNNANSDQSELKKFFEFYFGEVGTGTITGMMDQHNVPKDFQWMRLGKAVAKWVFSKSGNYDKEQEMRKNYDAASKALAMSILLNRTTVQDFSAQNVTDKLKWFDSGNVEDTQLDLMNSGDITKGVGGTVLTDSTKEMTANDVAVKVAFNNMIICNALKTKTSAAKDNNPSDSIVIPKIGTKDSWKKANIVDKNFKKNFDGANIKSDFALLALFLGYFNHKTGKMIDIMVKVNNNANQYIYNKLK